MNLLANIIMSGVLQFGIIPGHQMSLYNLNYMQECLNVDQTIFVDYTARADVFKYGFLTGGFSSYSLAANKGLDFYPFRQDYTLGAGFQYKNFEIGYFHGCYHPIAPNVLEILPYKIDSGNDQFYIKIKMGVK